MSAPEPTISKPQLPNLMPVFSTGQPLTASAVARTIDHALLKPEMTPKEVEEGCRVAAEFGAISVCAKPGDIARCLSVLAGTETEVGTVIGFPHGGTDPATKVAEAAEALAAGATELDMVLNIGWLKGGLHKEVEADIRGVVEAAADAKALVKVIFENALLTREEIVTACRLTEEAGADYVKTSTGFAAWGSKVEDLVLMRGLVKATTGVKAAGGLRTLADVLAALAAGANRVGASATAAIVKEARGLEAEHRLVVPGG